MANVRQRSRDLGVGPADRNESGMIGHVRPETKPIVDPEIIGRVSPKEIGKILSPGPVSPHS